MLSLLVRRTGRVMLTVSSVFVLVFVGVRLVPGGPAEAMLGKNATAEKVAEVNIQLGLDQPVPIQLGRYLWNALHGNLGRAVSMDGRRPVIEELARLFPATLELSLAALLIAVPVGILFGVLAARFRGTWFDQAAIAGSSIGVSLPVFFLGFLLLILFPAMPSSGRLSTRSTLKIRQIDPSGLYLMDTALAGRWDLFHDALMHLILPAVTLSSVPLAIIARVTRSTVLENAGQDFVRTARAKGGSEAGVMTGHVLPASAVPIASLVGMQSAMLLSGAVLTETVFQWPGLGRYIVEAAQRPDYNPLQGGVLLLAVLFVAVNFLTDLVCVGLDPRIRLDRTAGS